MENIVSLDLGYCFTFTIPAEKRVYYNGKRRPYASLAFSHQYKFIEQLMMKIINPLEFKEIDYVYEFHEVSKKRLHIHGYAITEDGTSAPLHKLRDRFYTYNSIIRLQKYHSVSDIQRTIYKRHYWTEYCQKHQDTIAYFSGYTAEKKYADELDNGIVKIELPKNNRYLESLDEHLESEPLSDSYKFGKFIVEL